ncbi:MAG: hypothetical protein HRU15_10000 [Planctomycetes bacterium]|nr:hypothetical protein [Planctomycetota bacterium]
MNTVKTYEEHLDYLLQMLRLKSWFLWDWLKKHPEEPFADCIRNRVDIYRKTNINSDDYNPRKINFDDPQWLQLEHKAAALYDDCKHRNSADEFEDSCFALFKDTVVQRSQRDYDCPAYVQQFKCGSLNFDPPSAEAADRVFMHIANALQPRSFFDDPLHLPTCLMDLMQQAEEQHQVQIVYTNTWVNQHAKWQALFPQSWQDHMKPADENILWHYGFWGQFISARGCFNTALGKKFCATGNMPFLPQESWIDFTELRTHLNKHYFS